MRLVESSIEYTFDLLLDFKKFDDCERLIDPAIDMFLNLQDKHLKVVTNASSI